MAEQEFEARKQTRQEAMAVEALQKKREAKYRLLYEEQVKARVLEQANKIREQRIELAKKARKEARIA